MRAQAATEAGESSAGAGSGADVVPGERPDQFKGFLTEDEFGERERQNLLAALEHTDWRVSGPSCAAELLGLNATTLNYRMKTFGLRRPPSRS